MSSFKITVLLLWCSLASCHHEDSDKVVTQRVAFGIEPIQEPLEDTSRYMICGTMMGERLNLNFDPDFSVFWEAFSKDLAKRNYASLIKRTRFPLPCSSGSGQDTTFVYEKKNFKQVFSGFISANVNGQSRLDRIKDRAPSCYVPSYEESVTIEGLVFKKLDGDWCLAGLNE